MGKQIITYGTNYSQHALYTVNSRGAYECANAKITRGYTSIPSNVQDCLDRFPEIKAIAEAVGFYSPPEGSSGSSGGSGASGGSGGNGGGVNLWTGNVPVPAFNTSNPEDLYFEKSSSECGYVNDDPNLGPDWMGCLWGTPSAPYSCTCPEVRPNYEAYIKHRLNVASFWNTPVETPVKRAEFLDALQYGRKIDVTIAGDFNLKVGQVVNIRLNGISGYPYSSSNSFLNGLFYIIAIKHVVTNSGTHETALSLSTIASDYSSFGAVGPVYP
jgi:hypothetical protein